MTVGERTSRNDSDIMTRGAYVRHFRGDYAALIPVKLPLFPRERKHWTWDMDAVIVCLNAVALE